MPKPTRRAAPFADEPPDLDLLAGGPEELRGTPPPDPARIAAAVLLGHALKAAGVTVEDASRDGHVVLVVVPSEPWTFPVRDEWRSWARHGERFIDAGRDRYRGELTWAAWAPGEAPRKSSFEDRPEAVAQCVSDGRHCAGITADVDWLPPDLVAVADTRLTLPALSGADIGIVARGLCGNSAGEAFPDNLAAAVTPRLLRLASRQGQHADGFIRRLRALVEQEAKQAVPAPATEGTLRDGPTLDRLHGMDEAVAWGRDVARDLAAFREGRIAWADVDRGCLLSGPPGCGKTMFAQALAASCDVPLITGSYGRWHGTGSGHQGDFLKALTKTFADARADAPCILFVDEVDSFPDRSTLTHSHADYMIQVVNAVLAEIDGTEGREGVVLVGACNHPERLDPALVRSGRLERHIRVRLPDRPALAAILREHLGGDLAGEDLSGAAMAAAGSSGADCERLVRGARRRARAGSRPMALADLLDEIVGSAEGPEDDWRTVAVHEAGHVVASCVLRPGSVEMVSLRGGGVVGGMTATNMSASAFLRADELDMNLIMLLAGRAAEEEVLGVPSSGAGGRGDSDLAVATRSLLNACGAFGLDDGGGLVWRGMTDPGGVSKTLAENPGLAERVRVRLDQAYASARGLIRSHLTAVEALSAALLDRRVLDGPEAEAIVTRHAPGSRPSP